MKRSLTWTEKTTPTRLSLLKSTSSIIHLTVPTSVKWELSLTQTLRKTEREERADTLRFNDLWVHRPPTTTERTNRNLNSEIWTIISSLCSEKNIPNLELPTYRKIEMPKVKFHLVSLKNKRISPTLLTSHTMLTVRRRFRRSVLHPITPKPRWRSKGKVWWPSHSTQHGHLSLRSKTTATTLSKLKTDTKWS